MLPAPDPHHTVSRQASGEYAAAYIRRLIFDGELRQDMRLPQDEVAKALGVSRIPVREAVVALEREGWVTTSLHRGAFVNPFDEGTIRDHYELFGLIYGLAARRAVLRQVPELADTLGQLAKTVSSADDPIELQDLAITFHSSIVKAAQSPRIPVVLRAMSALVPGPFFQLVPDAIEPARKGLAAIARAVKRGDAERASKEYGQMLDQQGELVVELFRRRSRVYHQA